MPDTVSGVLVLLIAILPGFLGDVVFKRFVGSDWRERDWRFVLRLLAFSFIGIAVYSIPAGLLGWPPPKHLFPSSFDTLGPDSRQLLLFFVPFFGHLAGGLAAGLLGVGGVKLLARVAVGSSFPCAWDDFARLYAPRHWVIVGLTSGEVYAGKLKGSDIAVAASDRDLILEEPCRFEPEKKVYRASNYQYLFIPASTWFSIAAVYEPSIDRRIIPAGDTLFPGEHDANDTLPAKRRSPKS